MSYWLVSLNVPPCTVHVGDRGRTEGGVRVKNNNIVAVMSKL